MEELHCIGCGSVIQSTNDTKPGFIPKSKIENNSEDIVCRRCFRLRNYNEVTPLSITQEDFYEVVSKIGNTDSLVVKIIDIFDIEGSLIPQIAKLTNHNDLIIIANKVDLLPKSVKEPKLLHHIKKIVSDSNLKPLNVYLMSALKYKNIDKIIDEIIEYAEGRNIYVVGATNVGKSTFINTLLKSYAASTEDVITVSSNAGTTLDLIEISIGDNYIIDTPGLINENQITHYLSKKALKMATPKKEIKPVSFQLQDQQTLFIGGLARVDFVKGDKTSFICYFSEFLKIHRTKLENADELYKNQNRKLLSPPYEGDDEYKLIAHNFKVTSRYKSDIVFPGLGFITVKGDVSIKVYVKEGTTPYVREALI